MVDSAASRCLGSTQFEDSIVMPILASVRTKYTPNSNEENALLSPIHHIPREILLEIFLGVLPHWRYEDNSHTRHDRMVSSHTCKRWRYLSLSTPKLWANISVKVDKEDCSRKLECAETWLARSGRCPLSIELVCSGDYQAQWSQLVALFVPHSRRWREACIRPGTSTRTNLSPIKHHLDMLESLTIFLEWSEDMPFEIAPKLRRISCNTGHLVTPSSLPWAQLTHVRLISRSAVQCLPAMRNLSSVVALEIKMLFDLFHTTVILPNGPLLRMEHLKDLTVIATRGIANFYECLDLPSLARYTYSEGAGGVRWSLPSFMSLISRSSCRLVSIDISLAFVIGRGDMALLLQILPDLVHLNLRCRHISGTTSNNIIAHLLVTRSATSFLLPQLEYLVLDYDKDFGFPLFFEMMESRIGIDEEISRPTTHRKRLRAVDICNTGPEVSLDYGVMGRLDAFAAAGVDITLLPGMGRRVVWYVRSTLRPLSVTGTD